MSEQLTMNVAISVILGVLGVMYAIYIIKKTEDNESFY